MGRERRKFTRITVNIPATLALYQLEAYHTGIIANICGGGCFFPLKGDLPMGERCDITVLTGEGLEAETVSISGTIVRSDEQGVGIRFDAASEEYLEKLAGIQHHESQCS